MGKCENKEQEKKLKNQSSNISNINGIDSKKKINDPIIEMSISKNSEEDIKIEGDIGSSVNN